MANDLSYELLLGPDEQDAFFHYRSWDVDLLEVINGDAFESTSVLGKTLLVKLLFLLRILNKAFVLGRGLVRLL